MVQLIQGKTKPMTKSQGRMTWKREYGKPTQNLTNPNQVFVDSRTKIKTKKARWEDRNEIPPGPRDGREPHTAGLGAEDLPLAEHDLPSL